MMLSLLHLIVISDDHIGDTILIKYHSYTEREREREMKERFNSCEMIEKNLFKERRDVWKERLLTNFYSCICLLWYKRMEI